MSSQEQLHQVLEEQLDAQALHWKKGVYANQKGFYQGYDRIGIVGERNTEKRFYQYRLWEHLSTSDRVLDIGSNCGFFTIHLAGYVKHVDGVEINPHLVAIGRVTAHHLGVTNVLFHHEPFEHFLSTHTYDVILSLANDETADGNTQYTFPQYIKKISHLLKKKGLLVFESQAADMIEKERYAEKRAHLAKHFTFLSEKRMRSYYPRGIPYRHFLILKKRNG